mmetsp:Transcript_29933/g.69626  ORF Transcript_29933/g.69626 Transcript_29933/m.69626 type:complete len:525 (-) Transcript_29933:209-1783(-)
MVPPPKALAKRRSTEGQKPEAGSRKKAKQAHQEVAPPQPQFRSFLGILRGEGRLPEPATPAVNLQPAAKATASSSVAPQAEKLQQNAPARVPGRECQKPTGPPTTLTPPSPRQQAPSVARRQPVKANASRAGLFSQRRQQQSAKPKDHPKPNRTSSVTPGKGGAGGKAEGKLRQPPRAAPLLSPKRHRVHRQMGQWQSRVIQPQEAGGRAQRKRFPVCAHWRNEHVVYEVSPKSRLLTAKSVFKPERTPEKEPRQRRSSLSARAKPRALKDAATDSSLGELAIGDAAPALMSLEQGLRSLDAEQAAFNAALPRRPCVAPQPSCLRKRGEGNHRTVSFAQSSSTIDIKNYGDDDLWYEGFAVECDLCETPLRWGLEGTMLGSEAGSRFSQKQVLCNACLAEKLYAEVGLWLTIALAGTRSADGQSSIAKLEATGPVMSHLETLCRLQPGSAGADLLTSTVGSEILQLGPREAFFEKVKTRMSEVAVFLRSTTNIEPATPRRCMRLQNERLRSKQSIDASGQNKAN